MIQEEGGGGKSRVTILINLWHRFLSLSSSLSLSLHFSLSISFCLLCLRAHALPASIYMPSGRLFVSSFLFVFFLLSSSFLD